MALSAVKSMNPPVSNALIGENYQGRLNQSLQNLLAEIRKETPNLSHFVDVFYELMQAKIDPPLESIWVYSALLFRSRDSTNEDPLNQLSAIRDLFQLVSACSSSCSSSKSIALLAPVILEVYKLVVELLGKDSGSKREKKVIREVKSLIEVILGYVSICCCKDLSEESSTVDLKLIMPVRDLVSVWMDGNESLQSFLPLLSNEICMEITQRGFDVNYLAVMVIVEAFILKLCLGLRFRVTGSEMERELRSWAVGAITGFGSFHFFEILVKLLLQPVLPITSLLNSEDGVLLRNILYDAVILVEYSFLDSQRAVHLPAEHVKSLTMARLIVTQKAIICFRENGDQKKATCYSSAFSNSRLPSQVTKWLTTQIGMHEKADMLRGSSPIVLIKWLLDLDRQGIKLFDDGNLKYHAKTVLDDSKAYSEQPGSKSDMKVDDDLLFYIDNKRGKVDRAEEEKDEDEEEDKDGDKMKNESISASFVAAAHSMKSMEKGGRKRKVDEGTERKKKNLKSDLGSSGDKISSDDSDSEVENPLSDSDEGAGTKGQ